MANTRVTRIKTITEFHQLRGFPKPEHPLISVVNLSADQPMPQIGTVHAAFDFYSIWLKRNFHGKLRYGQQEYDFDEGLLSFMGPGQVVTIEIRREEDVSNQSGWMLLVHPDFLWNTPLAKTIKKYEYFDYSVNEALFLSEKEEATIAGIIENISGEYRSNIDKFSQDIIIAQLELLLTYAERFYQRQFITRKITNHQLLDRLETLLTEYFNSDSLIEAGLPSVHDIAGKLNVSPSYLGSLLKNLTGQNTQQHIHEKLIAKAKEMLSTTSLSVSEIAYQLGFMHSQSFSKLFKAKTNQSPLEFRQSFN